MTEPTIEMWVIYDHPTDCPDAFIARKWLVGRGVLKATTETMTEPEVETLRKYFEASGLINLGRDPADDPAILECWT